MKLMQNLKYGLKHGLKYAIVAFFLFSSPLTFAFSQAELIVQLQKPTTIQGEFTQQRFLNALPKPITTSGTFILNNAPAHNGLLWQMEKPFKSTVRVSPKGIMQWHNQQWVENARTGQSQQVSLFLGLLSGNISALEQQFSVQLSGSNTDWTLTLTPKSLLMKQIFNTIILTGDRLVKTIELTEKQGDRTLITLQNNQLNQPLSAFAEQAFDPHQGRSE